MAKKASPRIFSGDHTEQFWQEINSVKPKSLQNLLYEFGCKCQQLETRVEQHSNLEI